MIAIVVVSVGIAYTHQYRAASLQSLQNLFDKKHFVNQ